MIYAVKYRVVFLLSSNGKNQIRYKMIIEAQSLESAQTRIRNVELANRHYLTVHFDSIECLDGYKLWPSSDNPTPK